MKKEKLTCKNCTFLVCIPDGNSGKRKPSCCFFHENHDIKSDKIQKDCSLFEKRREDDVFKV